MKKLSRLMILAVGFVAIIGTFASAADKYDIAAFYWPSCHFDERWAKFFPDGSQGEWESIRNCKPKWEGHWQPRVPAWGYLMDNDPAAMEKGEIKGVRYSFAYPFSSHALSKESFS